ncbi:helix-turn-helix domain-containing protein [Sulfurospirillum diekertiae]|nr:helix-turn-helix domain-containing protein [Sulfurospirillum diekertiae]
MIKKFLAEGFSKSAIARKLGISRETVRRYAIFQMIIFPISIDLL